MDFKKATDKLFERVDHSALAKALGVSIPLIRQARLDPKAVASRTAPEGWERAVIRLAEARAGQLIALADKLKSEL